MCACVGVYSSAPFIHRWVPDLHVRVLPFRHLAPIKVLKLLKTHLPFRPCIVVLSAHGCRQEIPLRGILSTLEVFQLPADGKLHPRLMNTQS